MVIFWANPVVVAAVSAHFNFIDFQAVRWQKEQGEPRRGPGGVAFAHEEGRVDGRVVEHEHGRRDQLLGELVDGRHKEVGGEDPGAHVGVQGLARGPKLPKAGDEVPPLRGRATGSALPTGRC